MTKHETAVDRVERKLKVKKTCLADLCGVDRTTPFHWNRPANKKNGRGGAIPDRYHVKIINEAKKLRVKITPADLFNG